MSTLSPSEVRARARAERERLRSAIVSLLDREGEDFARSMMRRLAAKYHVIYALLEDMERDGVLASRADAIGPTGFIRRVYRLQRDERATELRDRLGELRRTLRLAPSPLLELEVDSIRRELFRLARAAQLQ